MQLVRPLRIVVDQPPLEQAAPERSVLASARLQRRLTVEEAAKRAGVTPGARAERRRDIGWTRRVASEIQSLAYAVKEVRRADRFDYARTTV